MQWASVHFKNSELQWSALHCILIDGTEVLEQRLEEPGAVPPPGGMFLNSSLARVITHVLARVFLHVLARALLHVLAHSSQQFGLARVFLHVLARVFLHVLAHVFLHVLVHVFLHVLARVFLHVLATFMCNTNIGTKPYDLFSCHIRLLPIIWP